MHARGGVSAQAAAALRSLSPFSPLIQHTWKPRSPPPPCHHQHNQQPAVAFFNVGELAVDALVATLRGDLSGRLSDANLLAVVGNDAFDHSGAPGVLATALELYSVPGAPLVLPCCWLW